jgi:hypothetical protein
MSFVYARIHLAETGRLPDDWPKEKAERFGWFITPAPRPNPVNNQEKTKKDE